MTGTLERIGTVTGRVLNQLRRDHRLVALSLIFPTVIIYFINVLFDVLANPSFDLHSALLKKGQAGVRL